MQVPQSSYLVVVELGGFTAALALFSPGRLFVKCRSKRGQERNTLTLAQGRAKRDIHMNSSGEPRHSLVPKEFLCSVPTAANR